MGSERTKSKQLLYLILFIYYLVNDTLGLTPPSLLTAQLSQVDIEILIFYVEEIQTPEKIQTPGDRFENPK